jgi:hypothetical protein
MVEKEDLTQSLQNWERPDQVGVNSGRREEGSQPFAAQGK